MSIKDQDNDQLMFAFYLDIADWLPCKNLAILSKKDSRISGYNTVFCENIWFKLLFFSLIYCKLATELFKTKTMSNSISNINSGTFFECKVRYNRVRENGLEKKTKNLILIQGSSVDDVIVSIKKYMNGSMSDYKITKIEETAIMDVCNEID